MALGDIAKLIDSGKEEGYLTYGKVDDLMPHEVNSSEALDDLLASIGTLGIDVLEGQPKLSSERGLENKGETSDEVQVDLTPVARENTDDPVRIYLREMGAVPLLTREGEVDIAKRIECGQLQVLKALSRHFEGVGGAAKMKLIAKHNKDSTGQKRQRTGPRNGLRFSDAARKPPDLRVFVGRFVEEIAHEKLVGQRRCNTRPQYRQNKPRPIHIASFMPFNRRRLCSSRAAPAH